MAKQDSLILEVNATGTTSGGDNTTLVSALNSLASKLSSFETALKGFTDKTKAQSATFEKIQERLKPQQTTRDDTNLIKARASESRSAFNASPEGIDIARQRAGSNLARNEASRSRINLTQDLYNRAFKLEETGDLAGSRQLRKEAFALGGKQVAEGFANGLKNSTVWNTIGAIGGIGFITSAANKYIGLNQQIGQAALQNPILNNYDYGSTVGTVFNANAQQKYGLITGAATAIGGLAGAFAGPAGAALGASVLGGAAGIYGSLGQSKAALQANALGTYINNYMNLQALQGSNQAASGLVGNSINKNPGKGEYGFTDIQVPLIMTIAKGVGVYNNNFKAIDKLTKYAQSAQLTLGQTASLASGVGYFSRNKDFSFQKMINNFSTYGINPDNYNQTFNTAQLFNQAGFGTNEALKLAAQSAQTSQGFQGAQQAYLSQNISDSATQEFIGRTIEGFSPQKYFSTGQNRLVSERRKSALNSLKSGQFISDPNVLITEQLVKGYQNIDLNGIESRVESQARATPTQQQNQFTNTINKATRDAFGGSLDVSQASMEIGKFANGISGANISLDNFKNALDDITNAIRDSGVTRGAGLGADLKKNASTISGAVGSTYNNFKAKVVGKNH